MEKSIQLERKKFLEAQYYHAYGTRKFDPIRNEEYFLDFIQVTYSFSAVRDIRILEELAEDDNPLLVIDDLEGYYHALSKINHTDLRLARKKIVGISKHQFEQKTKEEIFEIVKKIK